MQIQQVWVDPEARGRGHGARGMRDLVRLLLETTPTVTIFVRAENAPAVVAHIRATRLISYDGNWNTLEDVEMTIFRPNGLTYRLLCPHAQFNSVTKEADAKPLVSQRRLRR